MDVPMMQYPPGDPRMVDKIAYQLKSQGIFDQFRRECIADVDTKPAYQNLHQRVEGTVAGFLANQEWRSDLNKNQLRDSLRKHIHESGFLDTGVERIVDQVVNPKIMTVFLPQIEEVVYKCLGIDKPKKGKDAPVQTTTPPKPPPPPPPPPPVNKDQKSLSLSDLLPKDLDPISPESDGIQEKDDAGEHHEAEDTTNDDDKAADEEEASPPFELIQEIKSNCDDNSVDSRLSGISELTSHESTETSDTSLSGNNQSSPSKIRVIDLSNHDSQLSKVSSGSRLSLVFSDDPEKLLQKTPSSPPEIDVTNDESQFSKSSLQVLSQESHTSENMETSNHKGDDVRDSESTIVKDSSSDASTLETTCSSRSPCTPAGESEKLKNFDISGENDSERTVNGSVKCVEMERTEKKRESGKEEKEKLKEKPEERKRSSSDSRDGKRSDSHSENERKKSEKEKYRRERSDSKSRPGKHDEKDVLKIDDKCQKEGSKDKAKYDEKNEKDIKKERSRSDIKIERGGSKERVKHEERDESKDRVKHIDKSEKEITRIKVREDELEKSGNIDKTNVDEEETVALKQDSEEINENDANGDKLKLGDKGDSLSGRDKLKNEDNGEKEAIRDRVRCDEKVKCDVKAEKDWTKERSRHDDKHEKEGFKSKSKYDDKYDKERSRHEDKIEREGNKEKIKSEDKVEEAKCRHEEKSEKEGNKEKYRHDEKMDKLKLDDRVDRDGSKDRGKHEDKPEKERSRHDSRDRTKYDEKTEKEGNKEKVKREEKLEKDPSKERSRQEDKARKEASRDRSRHSDKAERDGSKDRVKHDAKTEKGRSKQDTKEVKDEKSRGEDKGKGFEKVNKEKKDCAEVTKVEEVDGEKKERSRTDTKREKTGKDRTKRDDRNRSKHDEKHRDGSTKRDGKEKEGSTKHDKDNAKLELKEKDGSSKHDKDIIKSEGKEKDNSSKHDKGNHSVSKDTKSKSKIEYKDSETRKDDRGNKERIKSDEKSGGKDKSGKSQSKGKENNSKKSDRKRNDSDSSKVSRNSDHKGKDSRKKDGKSKNVVDDHHVHREKHFDDRRSADRDNNGTARGRPVSSRNSGSDSRSSHHHEKRESSSSGNSKSDGGGNSESSGSDIKQADGSDCSSDVTPLSPTSSLPFKKRPLQQHSQEGSESRGEYSCVNNAGKLILKLKKPRIAANIFEVRKIMHLRKSIAKMERRKQKQWKRDHVSRRRTENERSLPIHQTQIAERVRSTSMATELKSTFESHFNESDEEDLLYFQEEDRNTDFISFVKSLEDSETLSQISYDSSSESEYETSMCVSKNLQGEVAIKLKRSQVYKKHHDGMRVEGVDHGEDRIIALMGESTFVKSGTKLDCVTSDKMDLIARPLLHKSNDTNSFETEVHVNDKFHSRAKDQVINNDGKTSKHSQGMFNEVFDEAHENFKGIQELNVGHSGRVVMHQADETVAEHMPVRTSDKNNTCGASSEKIESLVSKTLKRQRSHDSSATDNHSSSKRNYARNVTNARRALNRSNDETEKEETEGENGDSDSSSADITNMKNDVHDANGEPLIINKLYDGGCIVDHIIDESVQKDSSIPSHYGYSSTFHNKLFLEGDSKYSFNPKSPSSPEAIDDDAKSDSLQENAVDTDGEDYSSIRDNNNIDKSSSDDEKCGDGMLSNELILPALRDLMLESGFHLSDNIDTGDSNTMGIDLPTPDSQGETSEKQSNACSGSFVSNSASSMSTGDKDVKRPRLGRSRRVGLARPAPRNKTAKDDFNKGRIPTPPSANSDFVMPLSPESDVSASSGELAKKTIDVKGPMRDNQRFSIVPYLLLEPAEVSTASLPSEAATQAVCDFDNRRHLRSSTIGTPAGRSQAQRSDNLLKPRPLFSQGLLRRNRSQLVSTHIQEPVSNCLGKRRSSTIEFERPQSPKRMKR